MSQTPSKPRVIDPGAEFSRPDGKSLDGLIAFVERNPDCTLRGGEGWLLVQEIRRLEQAIDDAR